MPEILVQIGVGLAIGGGIGLIMLAFAHDRLTRRIRTLEIELRIVAQRQRSSPVQQNAARKRPPARPDPEDAVPHAVTRVK